MKKNYNASVSFAKFWELIKDYKLIIWAVILFMLTFRFECGNAKGEFKYTIACQPLRIQDVKSVIK